MGPLWLLHACSYGSVDAVEFFIELGCSPNLEMYDSMRCKSSPCITRHKFGYPLTRHDCVVHNIVVFLFLFSVPGGETALSCAAKAGKDEILGYLLSLEQIVIPENSKVSC